MLFGIVRVLILRVLYKRYLHYFANIKHDKQLYAVVYYPIVRANS